MHAKLCFYRWAYVAVCLRRVETQIHTRYNETTNCLIYALHTWKQHFIYYPPIWK